MICAPMEGDELDRLELPQMVQQNTESMRTAFTVTVDAAPQHGVTTGISASDRATTLQLLASGTAEPGDFVRPGHIFPLRARTGGVLVRNGHTEAAVDLARLAGLRPAGAIVEIAGEDGRMLRLPELIPFARKHGLTIISIEDLIAYRRSAEPTVKREAKTRLPTVLRRLHRVRLPLHRRRRRARRPRPGRDRRRRGRPRPRPLRMPHRRHLPLAALRLRPPAARPPSNASPPRAGASSSTCAATRAAASACCPSCAPTNSRNTAATPSTPTWSWACPPTPGTTAPARRSSRTWASAACA